MGVLKKNLTKMQQEVLDYTQDEMLIRGVPGSGKTLIMIRRAVKLAQENPNESVAIFTFNKTLEKSAQVIIKELKLSNIRIYTFHTWAMQVYKRVLNDNQYFQMTQYQDSLQNAINQMRKVHNHVLVNTNEYKEFIKAEITWMKGSGIGTTSWEHYRDIRRDGRGIGLNENYRKIIFDIYHSYEVDKGQLLDYDDFGLRLSQNLNKLSNSYQIDHIFVDEGQDLHAVQLQVLRYICRKTYMIAADEGQKIYKTSFNWKNIGINFMGRRSKTLSESFRSTKQIIELANSLQVSEQFRPLIPSDKNGSMPVLCQYSSKEMQDIEMIKVIKQMLEKSPNVKIAILVRDWNRAGDVLNKLRNANLGNSSEILRREQGNPQSAGIKVTTYHSSKGLEFDFVLVLDLVEPNSKEDIEEEQYWELERRLLYVSMTRACNLLHMYTYGEPNRLLKELDARCYNKIII